MTTPWTPNRGGVIAPQILILPYRGLPGEQGDDGCDDYPRDSRQESRGKAAGKRRRVLPTAR